MYCKWLYKVVKYRAKLICVNQLNIKTQTYVITGYGRRAVNCAIEDIYLSSFVSANIREKVTPWPTRRR